MIDAQRAIEILKVQKSFLADINIDAHMAYKLAIESLEKRIALQVGYTEAYQSYYSAGDEAEAYCLECDEFVEEEDNYCCECGQKLDWDYGR